MSPSEHATPGWPDAPWRGGVATDSRIARGIELQNQQLERQCREGAGIVGWKIGANDPFARARWGISDCLLGYLPVSTCYGSERRFDLDGHACAAIEPELAIAIGEPVSECAEADEVEAAIVGIGLAAELVDIRGRYDDLAQVLAQNIFHSGAAIAESRQPYRRGVSETMRVQARQQGEVLWDLPIGALIPDVRAVVAFVARETHARGHVLAKGQLILSGVLTPIPLWARPGDRIVVSSDGFEPVATTFC